MLDYSKWDQVPQGRIEGAIVFSKGVPKGFAKPEIKELSITVDGIEFQIVYKISRVLPQIWRKYYSGTKINEDLLVYDPRTALDAAKNTDRILTYDDITGDYNAYPLAGAIPENTPQLTPEQIETRLKVFVTVANLCAREDVAAKIISSLPRKKNKTLHKGRLQPIAHLNLVDEDGWTYQLVAKNVSDTQACIELRKGIPVTSELVGLSFMEIPTDLLSKTDIFF